VPDRFHVEDAVLPEVKAIEQLPAARRAGKPKQHIVTAITRELTGFVWATLIP
jgi:hypothetical protein